RGAFHVTRPAWEIMRGRKYGRIINTSSGSGLFGNYGQANYAAAKMGLIGLTRVLAIEGERLGIRVNAIAPIARSRMTEPVMGEAAADFPPEYVSPLVAYLAHRECAVSGHFYSVGGGKLSRVFIAQTAGVDKPGFTAEDVAEQIAEIDAVATFVV